MYGSSHSSKLHEFGRVGSWLAQDNSDQLAGVGGWGKSLKVVTVPSLAMTLAARSRHDSDQICDTVNSRIKERDQRCAVSQSICYRLSPPSRQ